MNNLHGTGGGEAPEKKKHEPSQITETYVLVFFVSFERRVNPFFWPYAHMRIVVAFLVVKIFSFLIIAS